MSFLPGHFTWSLQPVRIEHGKENVLSVPESGMLLHFYGAEAVHTIITRPQKEGESLDSPDQQEPADRVPRTLNRYGSSSKLSSRQQVPV